MKTKPILFSGPMVRALLNGSKTQTRRVAKGTALSWMEQGFEPSFVAHHQNRLCPYGKPGDRLWVREAWMPGYDHDPDAVDEIPKVSVIYRADKEEIKLPAPSYEFACDWSEAYSEDGEEPPTWRPSIHMPRWASRITLEVTGVRVERLEDISEADAIAEGIERLPEPVIAGGWSGENRFTLKGMGTGACAGDVSWNAPTAAELYQRLWESINGPGSWEANPWVWVVEFKRMEGCAT